MTEKAEKMAESDTQPATVAPDSATADTVNKDQKTPRNQLPTDSTDVFKAVVNDQSNNFPDVTESYAKKIDAELKTADRKEHNQRRLKDSSGVFFDSDLHQTDEEGEPKKTVKGLWTMKRGIKRSAGKKRLRLPRNTDESPEETAAAQQAAALDELGTACDVAAEQTAGAFWAGMMALFGNMGAPSNEEAASLPPALSSYYRSTGKLPTIPAWMPPLLIMGTAVNQRLQNDEKKKATIKKTAISAYIKMRSFIAGK